jgi:hypothetical protein
MDDYLEKITELMKKRWKDGFKKVTRIENIKAKYKDWKELNWNRFYIK